LILIKESILAGIFCDMGSGNNIDICIILENNVVFNRNAWNYENAYKLGEFFKEYQ